MNEPKPAAFSFQKFQILKFSFSEPLTDEGEIGLEFSPSGKYFPSTGIFEIHMDFGASQILSKDKPGTPIIDAYYIATFLFEESIPFESIPSFFYVNSIAISFPYLRAFISTLTLQANVKLLMLPLMNLTGLEANLKENTKVAE